MKRCFYYIFAAVAIVASCAKEIPVDNEVEQPVNPTGEISSPFSGTIIQPGSQADTKVSIVNDVTTGGTYGEGYTTIQWDKGDKIKVKGLASELQGIENQYKNFYADKTGGSVYFGYNVEDNWNAADVDAWLKKNDANGGYEAYYPADFDFVRIPELTYSSNLAINTASLEKMPLKARVDPAGSKDINHTTRKLEFSSPYGILQITIPAKLNAQNLEIYATATDSGVSDVLVAEIKGLNNKDDSQESFDVFAPIAPMMDYEHYKKFRFVAKDENQNSVAEMTTYGEDANLTVKPNEIYFFTFCNTLTITSSGEYYLKCNGLDYKINIANGISGSVTIYVEAESNLPGKIIFNSHNNTVQGSLIYDGYLNRDMFYFTKDGSGPYNNPLVVFTGCSNTPHKSSQN